MNIKRERGVALYLALATMVVTLGVSFLGHGWYLAKLSAADQAGYDRAMSEVNTAQTKADNRSLLIQREQIINLTNALSKARNDYAQTKLDLVAARNQLGAATARVQFAAAPGSDLEYRLAAAGDGVSSAFGARAFRTAKTCRDDVATLGLGAGGLVESSASARYEHARAEALSGRLMPKSPFKEKE